MTSWKALAALSLATALAGASSAAAETITVGAANLLARIDPGADYSNQGAQNWDLVYDSLIRRDYDSMAPAFLPALATSWEFVTPDTLELKLREDVVFHNGEPMTADDVVFSLDRLIAGEHAPYLTIRKQFFESLKSVEAVDDYTVRVTTEPADPALLVLLSTTQASIVPADHVRAIGYDAFLGQPIGTGPFRVTEIDANNRIVFERFEDFWDTPPNVDTVILRRIPEVSGRVTALLNGEVDIITNLPPDQVPLIEGAPDVHAIEYLTPGFHIITYNTNNPNIPPKIRQAMNMAIDRDLLNEALWGGKAVVPAGHQYPQFGALYDPDRAPVPYDPDRARELLAEAGYDGQTIRLDAFSVYYTNGLLAAQAIAEMWKAVGIDVNLNIIEVGTPVDENTQARAWSNPLYFPDPAGSFGAMWSPTGARVPLSWNVALPNYAEVYDAFRYELDADRRRELYGQLMDLMDEEVPFTVLYAPVEYYAASNRIEWQPQPAAQPYTFNFRADNLKFVEPM